MNEAFPVNNSDQASADNPWETDGVITHMPTMAELKAAENSHPQGPTREVHVVENLSPGAQAKAYGSNLKPVGFEQGGLPGYQRVGTDEGPSAPSAASIDKGAPPTDASEYMNGLGFELEGQGFRAGWATKADERHPDRNEDTTYIYRQGDGSIIMAVFDGAGGHGNGDIAAQVARQDLHEAVLNGHFYKEKPDEVFSDIFSSMSQRVEREAGDGITTAVVIHVEKNSVGNTILTYGAVGDSLAFVYDNDDGIVGINKEESVRQEILDRSADFQNMSELDIIRMADAQGNMITNCLGQVNNGLNQYGSIQLDSESSIILTSDGVTGDKSTQQLKGGESNEHVLQQLMQNSSITPLEKSRMLVEDLATKKDDRTALVLEIDEHGLPRPEPIHYPITKAEEQLPQISVVEQQLPVAPEPQVEKEYFKDRTDALEGTGLTMDSKVTVLRTPKNGEPPIAMTGADIVSVYEKKPGEVKVRVSWFELDENNKVFSQAKSIPLNEFVQLQKDYWNGNLKGYSYRGSVQTINPQG